MNLGAAELIGLGLVVLVVVGGFFGVLPRMMYSIARMVGKGFRDGMNDKNP
jgi:Sec-independent protein translocase protein TatA